MKTRHDRLTKNAMTVLLAAFLAACSPISLVNKASPNDYYEKSADLAYGSDPRQRLDVYRPSTADGSAPVVVFFYGGGWQDGDKASYTFIASALTEAGITVVIPDYRLFPDVVFPAFVNDGAQAIAWTANNIAEYGGNPEQIFVMGHSAGAHIAALLALDQRYLAAEGVSPNVLKGLIGLSGPYDFLPLQSGYLEDVFPSELRSRSQPIRYVSSAAPATLLIHGDDDTTVRIENSQTLASLLRACGVRVEFKTYDGVGHARVVAAIAPPLDFLGKTLADTTAFIQSELAREADEGSSRAQQCGRRWSGY